MNRLTVIEHLKLILSPLVSISVPPGLYKNPTLNVFSSFGRGQG